MELEIVATLANDLKIAASSGRGVCFPSLKKILGGHFVVRMVTATIYTTIATITNYFVLIFL